MDPKTLMDLFFFSTIPNRRSVLSSEYFAKYRGQDSNRR